MSQIYIAKLTNFHGFIVFFLIKSCSQFSGWICNMFLHYQYLIFTYIYIYISLYICVFRLVFPISLFSNLVKYISFPSRASSPVPPRHGGGLDAQRSAGASKRRCRSRRRFQWIARFSQAKRVSLVKKDRFAQSGFGIFCWENPFSPCVTPTLDSYIAFPLHWSVGMPFCYCQGSSILRTCVSPWPTLMLLSAAAWQIQWKHGWETSEISFFKTGYEIISGHSLFKSVVINLH